MGISPLLDHPYCLPSALGYGFGTPIVISRKQPTKFASVVTKDLLQPGSNPASHLAGEFPGYFDHENHVYIMGLRILNLTSPNFPLRCHNGHTPAVIHTTVINSGNYKCAKSKWDSKTQVKS